jgi:hypothetical protein
MDIYLNPEESAELDRLREEHAQAMARADRLAYQVAMSSDDVRAAYNEAQKIWRLIRKLLDRADTNWRQSA